MRLKEFFIGGPFHGEDKVEKYGRLIPERDHWGLEYRVPNDHEGDSLGLCDQCSKPHRVHVEERRGLYRPRLFSFYGMNLWFWIHMDEYTEKNTEELVKTVLIAPFLRDS